MKKVGTVLVCSLVLVLGLSAHLQGAQGVININTATVEQLMMLPGIGEKSAQAIISYRQAHGAFKSVEELARVKGIGMKKVARLKPNLSLQGPNTYIPDQGRARATTPGQKKSS